MPKGVKKSVDIDTQIQQIEVKIYELEEQKNKLLQKKKEESAHLLLAFLGQHNISASDALESLTEAVAASSTVEAKEV